MGPMLTKDEQAVVKLLQHILSMRGIKYDKSTLEGLLKWTQEKGLIPSPGHVFEAATWEAIGKQLWDLVSDGGKSAKEVSGYTALWKLIRETLQEMSSERAAAASAFAALGAASNSDMSATPPLPLPPCPGHGRRDSPAPSPRSDKGGGCSALLVAPATLGQPKNPFASSIVPPRPRRATGARPKATQSGAGDSGSVSDANRKGTEEKPKESKDSNSGQDADEGVGKKDLYPPLPPSQGNTTRENTPASQVGSSNTETLLLQIVEKLEKLAAAQEEKMERNSYTFSSNTGPQPSAPPDPSLKNSVPVPATSPFLSSLSQTVTASPPSHPATSHLFSSQMRSASVVTRRWKRILRDAIVEGSFIPESVQAFLVSFNSVTGANEWDPLDWKLLEKARASVIQNGLHHRLTKQIINYIFLSSLLIPKDIDQIAAVILTPSQKMLFESAWTKLANEEQVRPRPQGDPLHLVQAQMLLGTGPFTAVDLQVNFSNEVLRLSQSIACQALLSVPDTEAKRQDKSVTVKQGLNEPFAKFVDRLYDSLEQQPDMTLEMKENIFKLMAFENANPSAKRLLATLPQGASVADMIELTNRRMQQANVAACAAAVRKVVAPFFKNKGEKRGEKCYNCGKKGHFQNQCKNPKVKKWCDNCQKDNHNTQECRRLSGNWKKSANPPRAQTQMRGVWQAQHQEQEVVSCPISPLPQQGVPEWTWKQQ
ncbi:uncharacterized protein LOC141949344 [Strix uralensis]|uniref:uncharacterized protein LOC141949344 n=1 Tax=Strix uralensis TaxID=36305 RepID=UPI003DA266EF